MRRFLFIAIALQGTHLALAGTSPLTARDVVLMLRMGYSTEDIVHDLEAKHFVGPLDANSEAEIRDLTGSSQLLDALKSGRLNATKEEVAQAEQKSAATNAEPETLAQQQSVSLSGEVGKSRSGPSQNRKGKLHAEKSQTVDLEIGQTLNLREFNGPNVRIIVNGIGMSEIVITLVHPRRMGIIEGGMFRPFTSSLQHRDRPVSESRSRTGAWSTKGVESKSCILTQSILLKIT